MAANLKTLDGIGEAREELYNATRGNEVAPEKARELERMLRGQQLLKGDLRVKFLGMIAGNKKFEPFAAELVQAITSFVNGPAALPERT